MKTATGVRRDALNRTQRRILQLIAADETAVKLLRIEAGMSCWALECAAAKTGIPLRRETVDRTVDKLLRLGLIWAVVPNHFRTTEAGREYLTLGD